MPIYEFVCRGCGAEFDKLVPYDWKSVGVNCPKCGSTELDQAVSRVGGISSGGKVETGVGSSCSSCSSGTCSTCN